MAAGHDLHAVDGDRRHVRYLVGQNASVHQTHRHETEHHEPKWRAAPQLLPPDALERLLVCRGLGRRLRLHFHVVDAAIGFHALVGRLRREKRDHDGQREHHAHDAQRHIGGAPADTADQCRDDGGKHRTTQPRARQGQRQRESLLLLEPIRDEHRDEQARPGHDDEPGQKAVDVKLPNRCHSGVKEQHEPGHRHHTHGHNTCAATVDQRTDEQRPDDAGEGSYSHAQVILAHRDAQISHHVALEKRSGVHEHGVACRHNEKAADDDPPAVERLGGTHGRRGFGHVLVLSSGRIGARPHQSARKDEPKTPHENCEERMSLWRNAVSGWLPPIQKSTMEE